MSETSWLGRRWKLWLNIATVVALAALVYAIRGQLADTFGNLARVHAWALLLLLPAEWLNYHAQAKMYQGLFAAMGDRLRYGYLFKATLELNFVNNVFPSGGVSGISYFGVRMRDDKITAARATVVQMIKLLLLFLAFEVLLLFGLVLMAVGGRVNGMVILVASSISTLLVVGTAAFVMIIGSQRRIDATFTFITQIVNKIIQIFRPKHPETINIARARSAFESLHQNYRLLASRWRELQSPFWWGLAANVAEVLAVYVVYIAFGYWVNFGAVILAYAVANFAGLVSVLPSGVGIYEALMTAVLAAAGIPARLSLPVTVMYRVLNTIIQLPPGYVYYHQTLHRRPKVAEEAVQHGH